MWPNSAIFNINELDHLIGTLIEETGEYRQACRSFLGRPFSPEKVASKEHMVEELGDILVPVIALSNQSGISFEEALEVAYQKLRKRLENKREKERLDHIAKTDETSVLKFNPMDHQPFKYDVEDEINKPHPEDSIPKYNW